MPTPISEILAFPQCPYCRMAVGPKELNAHVERCPAELARIRHFFEVENVQRLETLYGPGAIDRFKQTGSYAQKQGQT